jgi:hypothetical protein
MAQTPPHSDGAQRKRKPPKHFMKDNKQLIAKKRKATTLMHTMTQSSMSSTTSSGKSQKKMNSTNVSVNEDAVSASPSRAQPHAPKGDADSGSNNASSTQESNPELIEVSNGENTDDEVVEVVEDDDDKLGEHKTEFGRSVN